jgi:hypothetical protein
MKVLRDFFRFCKHVVLTVYVSITIAIMLLMGMLMFGILGEVLRYILSAL